MVRPSVRGELIPGSAFCHSVGGGGGGEVGSRPEMVRVLDRPTATALTWALLAAFAALPDAAPRPIFASRSFAPFSRRRPRGRPRRRPRGLAKGLDSTQKLRVAARAAASVSSSPNLLFPLTPLAFWPPFDHGGEGNAKCLYQTKMAVKKIHYRVATEGSLTSALQFIFNLSLPLVLPPSRSNMIHTPF